MAEVLVFVDKQYWEPRAKSLSDPSILLDHAISEERHIVEIEQALAAKLSLIGFDEGGQFRIASAPFRARAVDVTASLFGRELPSSVGIVRTVDCIPVGYLNRRGRLRSRRDPEVRRKAHRHATSVRTDHLAQRKAMHGADESAISRSDAETRESCFEFDGALVVVGDTGYAPRINDVLHQNPRHCGCQGLGLAAPRASQNDAMPFLNDGRGLLRVGLELG